MRTDCSNVYIFSFNAGADAGLAAVAAYSEREAFQILKNSGRYNSTPNAYSLIQCRDLGLSTTIRSELLLEVYTNALGAYEAFIKAINRYKGDKGDRGEKGAKGDKGERGEKGEKGDPADIGVLYWGNILGELSQQADLKNILDSLSEAVDEKYKKPATGIPVSDLEQGIIPDVSNFITKSVNDLANYYLKTETFTQSEVLGLISAFVTLQEFNSALAGYTTTTDLTALLANKQDVINDLDAIRSGATAGSTAYQRPGTGIPASDMAYGVIPDVSSFITNEVDDLLNYYLKSETYSSDDVDTLIENQAAVIEILQSAVQSLSSNEAVIAWDGDSTPVVANIPAGVTVQYGGQSYTGTMAADASTAGKTFYVGDENSDTKHRYISVSNGSTYSWLDSGTTDIDLNDYQRKDDDIWLTEEEFNEIAVKDPTKTYNIYEDVITI